MSGARCLWRRWCSGRRRARPPVWCALLGRAAWCARGRRPAREPSALRASLGASSRSPARPCRRPWVPQPGPPVPWPCCFVACGTADVPVPSGPAPAWCALLGRAAWCARGRRPAREPSALRASLGASSRSPARPRHRPRAPQPGPPDPGLAVLLLVAPLMFRAPSGPAAREIATREPAARSGRSRSPPVPSGPSGALHTGVACVAVCGGASPRSSVRPRRRPWVPQLGYPDPPAPSMPAVLPGFAIDRIARGYCTG